MFGKARAALDADVAAELAERFEEEKENVRAGVSAWRNPCGSPLS